MCEYVDGERLAPGFGCCKCKTYNGLQRPVCKACRNVRCEIDVPKDVLACSVCGFSLHQKDWTGLSVCPSCKASSPLIVHSVDELVQVAFKKYGGKGDAESRIMRPLKK